MFGVYNLSSLNSKIGLIAKAIANFHKSKIMLIVSILIKQDDKSYVFSLFVEFI